MNQRPALMLLAQSAADVPEAPFGAVVARQLSVWPFAARTLRLFVLVDPSLSDPTLRRGLVRAMQQGYFRSDGCSQTRAVREAALLASLLLVVFLVHGLWALGDGDCGCLLFPGSERLTASWWQPARNFLLLLCGVRLVWKR